MKHTAPTRDRFEEEPGYRGRHLARQQLSRGLRSVREELAWSRHETAAAEELDAVAQAAAIVAEVMSVWEADIDGLASGQGAARRAGISDIQAEAVDQAEPVQGMVWGGLPAPLTRRLRAWWSKAALALGGLMQAPTRCRVCQSPDVAVETTDALVPGWPVSLRARCRSCDSVTERFLPFDTPYWL